MEPRKNTITPPKAGKKGPILGSSRVSSGPPRWAVWGGLLLGLMAVAVAMNSVREPSGSSREAGKAEGTLTDGILEESWMATQGGKVTGLETEFSKIEQSVEEVQAQLKALNSRLGEVSKKTRGSNRRRAAGREDAFLAPPPPVPPRLPPQRKEPPAPSLRSSNTRPGHVRPGGAVPPSGTGPPKRNNLIRMAAARESSGQEGASQTIRFHLPTGTIMPGRLLMGVNAPTLQAGSENPHPVLMELTDLAVLPNEFQMDLQACFVLGEGVGNLSSERVDVRLLRLSCVREDHEAVDVELKGIVTDADGVGGVSGNVVWKEKALLAKALISGSIAGVSRAFQPYTQGFVISQDSRDALQFPDPSRVGVAGIAGGLGKAAENLARFYTRILEQIVPVIEVKPDRLVDMIVTSGRALPRPVLGQGGESLPGLELQRMFHTPR